MRLAEKNQSIGSLLLSGKEYSNIEKDSNAPVNRFLQDLPGAKGEKGNGTCKVNPQG